jgi:hypothetical protein
LYYEFKKHIIVPSPEVQQAGYLPTMNMTQFTQLLPPNAPHQDAEQYSQLVIHKLFLAFKQHGDVELNFINFASKISILSRGLIEERLSSKETTALTTLSGVLTTNFSFGHVSVCR